MIKIKHVDIRNEYVNRGYYIDSNGIIWYKYKNSETQGIKKVKRELPVSDYKNYPWRLVNLKAKESND